MRQGIRHPDRHAPRRDRAEIAPRSRRGVPAWRQVDPSCDLEKACLFGCGVATGFGAVWNNSKVEPFSSVAVFGLGAVGMAVIQAPIGDAISRAEIADGDAISRAEIADGDAISLFETAQAAKAVGAHPIVGVDVNAKKFELAKQLGATDCVNPKDHDGTPMQQAGRA